MAHRELERVTRDRHLTADEAATEKELREKIEADLPSLREQAKAAQLHKRTQSMSQTIAALKRERENQGLSLKDIECRTGVDERQLSQLEEQFVDDAIVVVLSRYAAALGKAIEIRLVDRSAVHTG
jgi:hypothetical protein